MLMDNAEGFSDVFTRIWQHMSKKQLVTFGMTSWSLWKKYNMKLWEDKHESIDNVLQRAFGMLRVW
jgi:hypothetical protein